LIISYRANYINIRTGEIDVRKIGSNITIIRYEDELEEQISSLIDNIINNGIRVGEDKYQNNETDWKWEKSISIKMKIIRYSQRYAIADCHKARLPSWIKRTHLYINIKNKDHKCFLWCVLRALHLVKHNKERISDL
jgi:hypothetical protein